MAAAADDEDRPHSREHQARKIPGGELYGRRPVAPLTAGAAIAKPRGDVGGGGGEGDEGSTVAAVGHHLSAAGKAIIVAQNVANAHDALGHSHHVEEARQRLEQGDASRLEREQAFIRERRKTQINEMLCCESRFERCFCLPACLPACVPFPIVPSHFLVLFARLLFDLAASSDDGRRRDTK